MTRGSRKHILDWTSQPDFLAEFERTVGLPECVIAHPPAWRPRGHEDSAEARLEDYGKQLIPGAGCWDDLAAWWLLHQRGANTPNWDLVVACTIAGQPGLALVEAKAHERELDCGGKHSDPNVSANSAANHERIGRAITEASNALDAIIPGVQISRDPHSQLANRVAYSWKLASMGVPIVLIYLGFTGDSGTADVGPPLRDLGHWQSVMYSYTAGVLPEGFIDRWLPCGKAWMRMILRSRAVLEASPIGT